MTDLDKHSMSEVEAQTDQALVRIEQERGKWLLKFDNDLEAIQSAIDPDSPQHLIMQNLQYLMGILLFIPAPERILILGVGGGSIIHFLRHHLPTATITGVEYNGELLSIVQEQMGLPGPDETLEYVVNDARAFIDQCQNQYDLIIVDLFDGGISPDWVLQENFGEKLKGLLGDQGAIAYNLVVETEDDFSRFYQALRLTFQQQTLCMDTEEYENILVYAANFAAQPKSIEEFISLAQTNTEKYDIPFSQILSRIFDINPQGCGMI